MAEQCLLTLGWDEFVGLSCALGDINSIPSLYPLDASDTSPVVTTKMGLHWQMSSEGAPLAENHLPEAKLGTIKPHAFPGHSVLEATALLLKLQMKGPGP